MTTDNITCKTCSKKEIPNWDGKGNCITCARDNVLGVDDTWIDELLQEAIVGENFVSYNEHGLAKHNKAKAAIQKQLKRAELRARIDELETVQRINSRHPYNVNNGTMSVVSLRLNELKSKEKGS